MISVLWNQLVLYSCGADVSARGGSKCSRCVDVANMSGSCLLTAVMRRLLNLLHSLQLHGTCLGLEALVNVIAGGERVLEQCEP